MTKLNQIVIIIDVEQIKEFILNNIKSLGYAVIFLVLGLIFVPESWIIAVLRKLKPNLIKKIKQPLKNFINILANLFINNKIIDVTEDKSEYNERSVFLLIENKKIEKNIYAIDLSKDIVSMFRFIYSEKMNYAVLEQAFNYLQHYAKLAVPIEQDRNFIDNFSSQLYKLEELLQKPDDHITDDIIKITSDYLVKNVFTYLNEERNKLEKLLDKNKNELVDLLRGKTHEL